MACLSQWRCSGVFGRQVSEAFAVQAGEVDDVRPSQTRDGLRDAQPHGREGLRRVAQGAGAGRPAGTPAPSLQSHRPRRAGARCVADVLELGVERVGSGRCGMKNLQQARFSLERSLSGLNRTQCALIGSFSAWLAVSSKRLAYLASSGWRRRCLSTGRRLRRRFERATLIRARHSQILAS